MNRLQKIFTRKISPLLIIPVILLFIIGGSAPFIIKQIKYASSVKAPARSSVKPKPIPEKTTEELELVYMQTHNPKTLERIIQSIDGKTTADYEKKLAYYKVLFETADESTIANKQIGYITTLYEAGRKEEYFDVLNVLFDDTTQLKKHTIFHDDMTITALFLQPIIDDADSKTQDYNYALGKLLSCDKPDELSKQEFVNSYLFYRSFCKIYYKMGDLDKCNYYKNQLLNQWDRAFDPKVVGFKNSMLSDLENYIKS